MTVGLNLSQFCREIGVSVAKGSKLLRTAGPGGRLLVPHIRIGRKIIIPHDVVAAFKARHFVQDLAALARHTDGRHAEARA